MDPKQTCRILRRKFNISATVLIAYYGLLNIAVLGAMFVDALIIALSHYSVSGADVVITEDMLFTIANNGWGYILAVVVSMIVLIAWKKPVFCFREIWNRERKMTNRSFWAILCVFLSGQLFVQVYTYGLEWVLNLCGLSSAVAMDAETGLNDSFSLLLYGAVLAPVFEEILFRGLILRMLQPAGKKFAIFASAYFFGVFHGNVVQTPFAFLVGLVLGYVTVEYSLWWAIVLHLINNLVLGVLMPFLLGLLSITGQGIILFLVYIGPSAVAVILGIVKRKEIKRYFSENKIHPLCFKGFFTSAVVWIFTGVMILNMVLVFLI